MSLLEILRDVVFTLVLLVALRIFLVEGLRGLVARFLHLLRLLPGMETIFHHVVRRQARQSLQLLQGEVVNEASSEQERQQTHCIPEKGLNEVELTDELERYKKADACPHDGRVFGYVYTVNDRRFETIREIYESFEVSDEAAKESDGARETRQARRAEMLQTFTRAFMHDNAINPFLFPSLKRFEIETVAMVAHMLHGDDRCAGNVTSGGTESILMAVKTYRDRARALCPHITHPEMVAPQSIHPAFHKAASYFNVTLITVPLTEDFTPDRVAYRKAINGQTILLLASAPQFVHGIVDPIEEISQLAQERGLPFHVDACFGGFLLPWIERLGYEVPVFDFRNPGVTSMSADVHKYGLGIKGSSVVVYRSADIRKHQFYVYSGWPGGMYASPTMAGSRPGGVLASSWATLKIIGQDGYVEMAKGLMEITALMTEGIKSIPGLALCGRPHMTAFAVTSTDPRVNVFALAAVMETKGWHMERQTNSLHFSVLPSHTVERAKEMVRDLKECVEIVKADPSLVKKGTAAMYELIGTIPDKTILDDYLRQLLNTLY